ncbi:MAG: PIG-L family deacetylase [SAR324 cluster bacterium]|nr:PIG-L family deacetylase [SAR324 cluster bacterium]
MKLLAIGAHPDDIELGCGGTLALASKLGHQIWVVIVSGDAAFNYENIAIRTSEQAATETYGAMEILGVEQTIRLGFADKDIPYNSNLIERLDKIITEFRPDRIFTHWPFDTHQDHCSSALSSISASRYFNSILMVEPLPPSGRSYVGFRPQLYIDITSVIDTKLASLKAHRSQYARYGERWIKAVESRASHRGFEMGVNYAETFEVMRFELKL